MSRRAIEMPPGTRIEPSRSNAAYPGLLTHRTSAISVESGASSVVVARAVQPIMIEHGKGQG